MILDTNAVSALLGGDPALDRVVGTVPQLWIPSIVLGEYRYGLRRSKHAAALEQVVDELEALVRVLQVDGRTARCYAEVREGLRLRGTPIPENDVWIAALALQHAAPVVSRDVHFDWVHGIERVTW